MRILITGASSLPGFRTTIEALEMGYEVLAIYHRNPLHINHERLRTINLDIRNTSELSAIVSDYKPECIIHMAALGDVDLCESDKNLAWKTTVEPSIALAKIASKTGIFSVYLSTDYVFDGVRGNYCEDDVPNPVNYYGLTKMAGEIAFRSSGVDCAIVRTSSIYGLGPGRMNFAKFLIERIEKGEEVRALIDQYTSPTYAQLLASAILEIVERRLTGIFHVAGERMSRYEFALRVAEKLGLNKELIKAVEIKDVKWVARRPKDSSLNTERTRRMLRTDFYSLDKALRDLKSEYERRLRA